MAVWGQEFGVLTNSDQGHVIILESPKLFGWETCSTCTGATAECTPGTNCYFDVYVPKRYAYLTALPARRGKPLRRPAPWASSATPTAAEFDNYAYNANADAAIQAIAVRAGSAFSTATSCADANVGSSNYFSKWTKALNLGFHVGPIGRADAHCNNYGVAVPTRTVYLLPNTCSPVLTKRSLLAAHKARHFFATEDPNLQLVFATADKSHDHGRHLSAGASATLRAAVYDPDGESVSSHRALARPGRRRRPDRGLPERLQRVHRTRSPRTRAPAPTTTSSTSPRPTATTPGRRRCGSPSAAARPPTPSPATPGRAGPVVTAGGSSATADASGSLHHRRPAGRHLHRDADQDAAAPSARRRSR